MDYSTNNISESGVILGGGFFYSDDVNVYPSSRRDKALYRQSRVSTEHNIVEQTNAAISSSYIMKGLELSESDGEISITAGEGVIAGYHFSVLNDIDISSVWEEVENDGYICLALKTNTNLDNGELVSFDDAVGIDSDSLYHGLAVLNVVALPTTLKVVDSVNGIITYLLPIAKKDLGAIDNLYADDDRAVSDPKRVRIYSMKYQARDVKISINDVRNDYSSLPQSLETFLEKFYIIDDGEVV